MINHDFVEIADNNEAISDSLVKVIEAYDRAIKGSISIHNIWRRYGMEHSSIKKLKDIAKTNGGWWLEGDWECAEAIKNVLKERDTSDNDLWVKRALDYLAERIEYIYQRQRRAPAELTAEYKVLLIGAGWVIRSHVNNPVMRNSIPSTPDIKEHLNLKNRLYTPEQVYTVDRNPAQLPDLCCPFEEIQSGELPDEYFDFVYFEGICFENHEQTQKALSIASATLKDEGLMIYHDPKPNSALYLMAKMGNLTQEKLNKIPPCIIKSVGREYNTGPLEGVIENPGSQIVFTPNESVIKQQQEQFISHIFSKHVI